MAKTNEKNIIWNTEHNNTNYGIISIEIPDDIIILQNKITDQLITVSKKQQNEELINGRPCYETDKNWKKPNWFYDEFYGHNNIKINGKVLNRKNYGITLGQALKKINKIEHLFPQDTEINLVNHYYIKNSAGGKTLDLKYKTSRNFKGITIDGFKINKPSLLKNFIGDILLADLINFLRRNGFIFFIDEYDASYYKEYGDVQGHQALGYGHGLVIGISEFNNHYNGYISGKNSILFDTDECFDKWSRCIEIPKPKDKTEFEAILKTLIEFDYDKIED